MPALKQQGDSVDEGIKLLVRRYLPLDSFDVAIDFHETLIAQKVRLRFDYTEYDLKLAQVASILFIAGSPESLQPFGYTHDFPRRRY